MTYFPHKKGFTLVELIVSIGIFALVMVLAAGSYLVMIGLNRQAQATATNIDNLSFALENMARAVRTGTDYDCASILNCPSGGQSLTVKDAGGNTVRYQFTNSTIQQTVTIPGNSPTTSNLTESTVTIDATKSYFYVTGVGSGDGIQPRVIIFVSGKVAAGPGQSVQFAVEAESTMRGPEI